MNGSSAINYPINEQLIGKFHVINVDKLSLNNHEDIIPQTSLINDETGCTSRFQMIRVDRNFGRGRWKVNDYEPPENTSISINPSVNTIENESINNSTFSNVPTTTIPTVVNGDSTTTSSATLASTAAPVVTAFQQQQQRIAALNNTQTVVPTANVPPPTGLIHPYPPAALANQSYLLPNHHHHQFGYCAFFPPYSPYATPWAVAAALNPYLQHPTLAQQPQTTSQLSSTTNFNDPNRVTDTVSDINSENIFSNLTTDQLQNAQLAATAAYIYAAQHAHSTFIPQASSTASSYATIPSYHPVPHPPTILPPQTLPFSQIIPNNTTDIQLSHQVSILTSPKHDGTTKTLLQPTSLIITPQTKPLVTTVFNGINNDLISSSPIPPSPLNDIWTYTTTGSPLNLTQTAAVTAAAAMNLLNNDTSQNTEIANEILKELTTPTKQNNTTDIDNKISAAMDLVKMHLLSAVREEVTELRQQIRILNEKVNSIEHENAFLRQHISSEIYAQYIPLFVALSSSNDSTNSTTNTLSSSSQPVPMTSLSTIPSSLVQQTTLSTNQQASLSTTNLSLI